MQNSTRVVRRSAGSIPGEDHGLDDYQDDLDKLDLDTRRMISDRVLPLQQQTHDRMSSLKKRLARA